MRFLHLLAFAGLAAAALPAEAGGLQNMREQDRAYRAAQQGEILPLPAIRSRIRVPGAEFIGAEFDGRIYRLKYMRGTDVIWVDVDARTGRVIGRQ
ncbi:MAG: hypothetical protein ACXWUN_06265 [Allosphingosinicella sp.]